VSGNYNGGNYNGVRPTVRPGKVAQGEYARTTEEGERQMRGGESDSFVVPVKAGNAAGGKEATHDSAE
jgi:hypothetical protein